MGTMVRAIADDCKMEIIGIRPGERINERLIHVGEAIYTRDCGDVFKVWPAYSGAVGSLDPNFEYTSDKAKQLTVEEMRVMIAKVTPTIGG
jgi:UDP-N-acetylglucosamine 4,6-dehydratase